MPIPTPNANEDQSTFISRCMGDDTMNSEYPDQKQRAAVCHTSWRDSKKELSLDTAELVGVEILRPGKFNASTGDWNVTNKEIDEIIKNFDDKVLEPVLNLAHSESITGRVQKNVKKMLDLISLGFVSKLYKRGETLVADFKQVPKKLAEIIKAGPLKNRSVEVWAEKEIGGKLYHNVLSAVSFLGLDAPAVNGLADDFEILLKLSTKHPEPADGDQSVKILFREEKNMEEIKLSQKEYNELVSFKTKAEDDAKKAAEQTKVELKAKDDEIVSLKAEKDDLSKQVKDLEKIKAKAEEDAKVALQSDAENYIVQVIKDGKILPKFKEQYIEDYITKSEDAAKLKLFKEDIDSRDKVIDLGELEDNTKSGKIDLSSADTEKVEEAIEVVMKRDNCLWEDAAKKIGAVTDEEV